MSTLECPDCRKWVSAKLQKCPHCGRPMRPSWIRFALTGVAIFAGIILITGLTAAPATPQDRMRKEIRECEQRQAVARSPDEARALSQECYAKRGAFIMLYKEAP